MSRLAATRPCPPARDASGSDSNPRWSGWAGKRLRPRREVAWVGGRPWPLVARSPAALWYNRSGSGCRPARLRSRECHPTFHAFLYLLPVSKATLLAACEAASFPSRADGAGAVTCIFPHSRIAHSHIAHSHIAHSHIVSQTTKPDQNVLPKPNLAIRLAVEVAREINPKVRSKGRSTLPTMPSKATSLSAAINNRSPGIIW